jgi:hypothetical protein
MNLLVLRDDTLNWDYGLIMLHTVAVYRAVLVATKRSDIRAKIRFVTSGFHNDLQLITFIIPKL